MSGGLYPQILAQSKEVFMSFLPDNYDLPQTGSSGLFMKLEKGDNKVRILAPPLLGYSYWDTKDVRHRIRRQINNPYDMRQKDQFGKQRIKHFWALKVWDFGESAIRILEITQANIQKQIMAYNNDSDWGDPSKYNLKIIKTGEGTDTEYKVIASPSNALPPEAEAAMESTKMFLEALFFNCNPIDADWQVEGRNKIYEWLGALFNEAHIRGVECPPCDLDNWKLSECLTYYENVLELVSKAEPAKLEPVAAASSAEEIPF